jgi:multiple sugar transport system ATP-binding protein
VPKAEQAQVIERVAGLLQLGHLLDRKPSQLSGGQRQRVAMGRALVRDPELFLFDEPLSNLDAKLRVEMRTEIKRLHQRLGTTIVYVTHDQVEAMTLASRIAVMHQGLIQQLADPRTVYERPANLFVAGFMGSPPMNFVPATLIDMGQYPGARIANGEGGPIELALPPRDGLSAWHGREVILGIRPEQITQYERHRADERPWLGPLDSRVEVVEPTGAETMVVIHLGGREVIARVEPDAAQPVGSQMRFGVDMAKACVFDPATERLI